MAQEGHDHFAPSNRDAQLSLREDMLAPTLRFVLWIAGGLAIGFAIGGPLGLIARPEIGVALSTSLVLVTLGCIALMRRGQRQLSAGLLFSTIWLMITGSMVMSGGWNSVSFTAYTSLIVLVGFSTGIRTLIVYAIASSAAMLAVSVAARAGWVPAYQVDSGPLNSWFVGSMTLAMVAVLVRHSVRSTDEALREARANERAAVDAIESAEASGLLLEERARQQAMVAELGRVALEDASVAELMARAADAIAETLGVDFVSILEVDEAAGVLRYRAGLGWAQIRSEVPIQGAGQAGYTLEVAQSVIVTDFSQETRFELADELRERGVVCAVSVLIPGIDRPYGVLAVFANSQRRYTDDDVHFLEAVANLITMVVRRSEADLRLHERDEQLRQAQKMEAIGQLAGGIAHDFNNLLQAIIGFSEVVQQRHQPGDESYDDLQEVRQAADQAAALTKQLLAFGRRQVLKPILVDVNELIEALNKLLERLLGEHIAIRFEPCASKAIVHADAGQLEQVVINLCVNARDAMPEGGELLIRTRIVESLSDPPLLGAAAVELSVSDTGTGIQPDVIDHIFEPFFTTKDKSQGTGLGLATVYGIVQQHGGIVQAEIRPERGTVFRVLLPSIEPSRAPAAPETPDTRAAHTGGDACVLVAEDDDRVRALTALILRDAGYRVVTAKNGAEAVTVFREHADQVALAVLDIVMPDLSGPEAASKIRQIRPHLPVVFCSGYNPGSVYRPPKLDERTLMLNKPYESSDLLRIVGDALEQQGG